MIRSGMTSISPKVYWENIQAGDCLKLDLSPMWLWEGLYVEWFGRGALICARVRK